MNEYEKKYIGEIIKAVNVFPTQDITDKLRQIINKIYDDGYVDGVAEYETYVEEQIPEPIFDWNDMD